ncbi:calmodulin, putative [Entamoeba invadens IP1]|uniref:Calmodulin, putative n=1 Tax=Entamoeba invadens IP1 TaxID=370355 RepID=A0A0A1TW36_ENTIV|nr:calmodulin, putative [Entamoeba invadens IP1]ELP84686.1 calmodulin, putative [Entamoeba invadens IP1]|eukprot:XP_004184032.1 calmodulin, putative [Entamoeba invadens IP1]
MAMTDKKELTVEQQQEYKEAFQLFDKDNDGKITAEELGTVMRALGANPTMLKISEIVKQFDKENSGKFDQATFLNIMLDYGQEVDSTEDIKKAFEIFDKERNGFISASELKHVLTTLGEKLSEQEVDDLLKEIGVEDGFINVEAFVKLITSK